MRKTGLMAVVALLLCAWASPSLAALTVEITNGYNLVVDSNITAPSTYGPKSAFIGAKFCNTGGAPLSNVFAYVGNYNGGVGDTPGIFPMTTFGADPLRPHLAGTGSYSLTLEAGSTGAADGTRYIGTLAAGACRMQYWLFSYPQCVNVGGQPQSPPCDVSIAGTIQPTDDLSLDYDVWATSTTGPVTTVSTRDFTMRNEISAAANKIWPNTTSKVPDAYLTAIESVIGWGTLGPDGQPLTAGNPVYPGQRVITTQGIWYDLGNVGHGFDNNGDLIPDQNAWLQPVGDPGSFDADCFRMVNVYGIVIVKLKTGGELLIPFQNQLYYENIPDNTGVVGLVYYQFIATDTGCSANMTPYQEAASGFDNEKFSADYGLSLGLASGSYGTKLTFTKSDGVTTVAPGAGLTYTVSANNVSTGVNLGAPDLGTPLTFHERIPSGATFVAGSADDAPATNLTEPTGTGSFLQGYTDTDGNLDTCTIDYSIASSSYVVLYSADSGATWTLTEPAPATVTDIQWLLLTNLSLDGSHDGLNCVVPNAVYDDGTLETSLPVGKTASVAFGVTVKANPGPVLCNSAYLQFGPASSGVEAEDCDLVTGNNSLSGVVFKDDGVGASTIFGNGTKETNEGVIGSGVIVTLSYDRNGDGLYDSGDIVYGSTTSDAGGAYSFSTLPDGPFLVVVKKYDGATSDGINNAATDSGFGTTGWGNTTFDPNLALTTDQGILKLNEDPTTATLAVNIDLDGNNGTGQSLTGVNFGFAPPLRLTKTVPSASVSEGALLNYTILLENRLPSTGKQGPTGCQYTVWAPTCVNGSPATKEFTNPGNACDATNPNSTTATAVVTGGGLRWIYGTGFVIPDQAGAITKVEGLFFGYFNVPLTDDFLNFTGRLGAGTTTGGVLTAQIDSYVGPRPDFDPDSAISWVLARPGGGSWSWADDFSTVQLEINPSKTAAADAKVFALDAIGLRITTDADCVAGSSTTLSPVPLMDRFDTTSFTFVSANPAPTSVSGGTIKWDDVGPILPGSSRSVTVTVKAVDVNGTRTGTCAATSTPSNPPPANSACNLAETAYDGKNVYYADGRQANDADAKVPVNIAGKAELRGTVWSDANNDGWPDNDGEPRLPNVGVALYACVQDTGAIETSTANKTCAAQKAGNYWKLLTTAVTDASGSYEFIGLDTGTYIVEVGDTDGAPQTGNTSPYGGTQKAEPNDAQTVDGSNNAQGTAGVCAGAGGCNNTWGNPANNLSAHNQLDAGTEETINGVNFGYNIPNATIHGNVWHDIDGDAAVDGGESGLAGFTVRLYSDPNGDGDPADGVLLATTTSDSSGNYSFSGLAAASYVIAVTPPTLLNQSWVETHETTGGTGSLNNQIPVALTAGQFSGSHDFGYTLADTSDIGDTVYFDFDGDGVQDAAEAGIPNITVWLYRDVDRDGTIDTGVDDLLATDVTDASGKYLFVDLPAGSYVVKVDTADPDFPSDVTATGDPDLNTARIGDRIYYDANGDGLAGTARAFAGGTTNGSPTVTSAGLFLASDVGAMIRGVGIPIGAIITGFTNASTVTISANATATGAPTLSLVFDDGIAGVVVHLYSNTDGDNTIDPGEPLVAAAVTDTNGNYLFTELVAGNYLVEVDTTSLPSAALARTSAAFTNIALATNSSSFLDADAGYSPVSDYALGSRVWSDADGDNVQDSGEMGIAGVRITVTNGTGTGCAAGCTVTTDAGGFWIVTGLTSGTFSIDVDPGGTANQLTVPRGFLLSSGTEPRVVTISSADNMGADFGYRYDTDGTVLNDRDAGDPTGTIDGRVFVDVDADGVYGRNFAGVTTNASTTVTSTGLFLPGDVGSGIEGVGIPLGATITAYTNASTVTISAAATATGTPTLTVAADTVRAGTTVNMLDEDGFIVATTNADANGMYYFGGTRTCTMSTTPACSGIFVGQYTVQAVDTLGTFFSVLFLNAAQNIANLNVVYNATVENAADSQSAVSVDGVHDDLMQDFGYQRFQGSIGDTVYQDVNENATQDFGEPGIAGVTVRLDLWKDAVVDGGNGDGFVDAGEITVQLTAITTADDPLTAADEGGKYLFSNLEKPPGGQYFLVRVDTGTFPAGSTPSLIADPDTDGDVCPLSAPLNPVCDSEQVVSGFSNGINYLGADFGYRLTGTGFATIGDYLWVDTNGNGVKDSGEVGVRYVAVWLDTDNNGFLGWTDTNGNGEWDSGEGERWVETDTDGYYVFTNLADATYNVRVLTSRTVVSATVIGSTTVTSAGLFLPNDVGAKISGAGIPAGAIVTGFANTSSVTISTAATATGGPTLTLTDWPAGLPTTPTYEARPLNAASLNNFDQAVVAGGVVTQIIDGDAGTPDACTNCNLDLDFGYRYAGTNALSGTVCGDDASKNGYCGATATTYNGVAPLAESALAGIQVTLYRWTDDGDNAAWVGGTGVLDGGDTFTLFGSTATDANGNYSFSNVPDDVVVVLGVSDTQNLRLTTTNANTSVEDAGVVSRQLHEGTATYEGNTVTVLARQALNLGPDADNAVVDLDFAFDGTLGGALAYDFGDLPDSGGLDYNATLLASSGAQHRISSLFLGAGVTSETNGQDSAVAALDGNDDGVVPASMDWVGHDNGASVNLTASAAGWAGGWVDFNEDGDFDDYCELIVNQAVGAGLNTISFNVPGFASSGSKVFFARFRIYPQEPLFLSSKGLALDAAFSPATGEVEDYRWDVNVTAAVVSSFAAYLDRGTVTVAWETAAETGTAGFYLRRWDWAAGRYVDVNAALLPALHLEPQGGSYRYRDQAAFPGGRYDYLLVEVEASGARTIHGPFTGTLVQSPASGEDPVVDERGPSEFQRTPHRRPRTHTMPGTVVGPRGVARRGTYDSAKIGTRESGLYYLDLQTLADTLGVTGGKARLQLLARNHVSLTTQGEPVAFLPDEAGGGLFFYAERLDSIYTRDNVTRVETTGGKGLSMAWRSEGDHSSAQGDETFSRTVRAEQDLLPGQALTTDPESDSWYWDYFFGGWDTRAYPIRTDAIDPNSARATLTVRLKGGTNTAAVPDHHAVITLNGNRVGDVAWDGLDGHDATYSLSPSLFIDGENTLEIAALSDTAAPYSIFYLDSFSVTYESYYRACDDTLAFTAAGNAGIRVGGFTRPDILLFDVTDPRRPVFIPTAADTVAPGEFGLTIAPQSRDGVYHALTADRARAVDWIRADVPSSLSKRENGASHLIITTGELKGAAQRLAEHRSALGSQVVEIEDVYDEFNHGIASPYALRSFLSFARSAWSTPPRYVVLAGDGTYDYLDNQGAGGNLLPPKMVETPYGLFPSDNWFADVEGNRGAPEMAVGRLPAASAGELTEQIVKIIARENATGAAWLGRIILLADNPDGGGDFTANSAALAALVPPGIPVDSINLGGTPIDEARERLLGGIQDGAGLINYVGHAGFDVLADEGLLRSSDVEGLLNADKATVLTAQTCIAGHFAVPGYPSIGESLLRKAGGGAAAVWAPTGLSQNELAALLAAGFYAHAFGSGGTTIGDAILAATRAYELTGNQPYLIDITVLLGDPAMPLR